MSDWAGTPSTVDAANKVPPAGKINTPEHSKTVYDIAAESIVLLKK